MVCEKFENKGCEFFFMAREKSLWKAGIRKHFEWFWSDLYAWYLEGNFIHPLVIKWK